MKIYKDGKKPSKNIELKRLIIPVMSMSICFLKWGAGMPSQTLKSKTEDAKEKAKLMIHLASNAAMNLARWDKLQEYV